MKKALHLFVSFFVDNYLWVSIGAVLLALQTAYKSPLSQSWPVLLIVFGGSLNIYHFHRWYKPHDIDFKSRKLIWMTAGLFLSAIGLCMIQNLISLFILAFSGALAILYIIPVQTKSFSAAKSFRERQGFKLWIISLTWVLITVTLPLHWAHEQISFTNEGLLSLERFCFIAGITIPFDIRDVYTDDAYMKTYPQSLGLRNSKSLALLLLLVAFCSSFALYLTGYYSSLSLFAIALSLLLSSMLVYRSRQDLPKWYFSFVMDGLTLAQPLIFIFFSTFNPL
jgi:1,4-dihydroxy-2-naphthoate octaprenyltransferase